MRRTAFLACIALVVGCRSKETAPAPAPSASAASTASVASSSAPPLSIPPPPPPPPPEVELVDVPDDLPVFVVRGRAKGERMVFIHGLCGNPNAYAWSFKESAAELGTLIAIQGNKSCGPDFRDWSLPPAKVNERIESAFRAIGDTSDLRDLVVIGYSSGGTYAELLTMLFPERYTRAILIANPRQPGYYRLKKTRAVVMMAGEHDRHDLMKGGMRELKGRGIPSTFMILPGATHGMMGPEGNQVMGEALRWLLEHQR